PRFRVILAADAYEAGAMLSKSVPGMILLDVEIPRMGGMPFLKKLMRQHPLPVVLCTNQAKPPATARRLGALGGIAKPDWRDGTKAGGWPSTLLGEAGKAARAGRLPMREDHRLSANDPRHSAEAILPKLPFIPRSGTAERVVAIGVS